MAKRAQVPVARGEAIVYRARDLRVVATESDTRRRSQMRVVATGKAPEGRFPEGQVGDFPEVDGAVHPDYQDFLDKGWHVPLDPVDDPGRTKTQIANSIVRGDTLNHPVDAEIAEGITDAEAYAITHTGDPEADPAEADPHELRGSTVGHRGVQLQQLPQGAKPGEQADQSRGGRRGDGRQVVDSNATGSATTGGRKRGATKRTAAKRSSGSGARRTSRSGGTTGSSKPQSRGATSEKTAIEGGQVS